MWATLVLAAALETVPQQPGMLKIVNDRPTHGFPGGPRDNTKLLPGDVFFVSFDIEGLSVAEDGKISYSMGMELKNIKDNKVIYRKEAGDPVDAFNSLGGTRLPAFAVSEIGTDTVPGEYMLTVNVVDRKSSKTAMLQRKFDVVQPAFGMVRFGMSYDGRSEMPAPWVGVAGQSLWVNFMTVGFERDAKKQPNLKAELRIFDEAGKPTLQKEFSGTVNDVPENYKLIPMQFIINLNRAGKYKVELTATDLLSKKTVTHELPITVKEMT